jgi:polar amino acid transport system substrate-binding protein
LGENTLNQRAHKGWLLQLIDLRNMLTFTFVFIATVIIEWYMTPYSYLFTFYFRETVMIKKALLALVVLSVLCGSAWSATKIVFAVDATWPPMEFVDDQKNIVGYAIDFLNAAGKEAGFTPVFKNTAWDGIFAGLAAGKYDVISSSVSITEARKKAMDFSEPYFTVRQALIVPKDSTAESFADLKGKKVGGQIGTTGYFAIKKADGLIPKSYDEIGLAMEDLNVGRIGAVVCDDPVAANYALIKYKDTLKIAAVIETGDVENYGFAVKKGDKKTLDLLNKGIAAVKAKGIDTELIKKWIGQ